MEEERRGLGLAIAPTDLLKIHIFMLMALEFPCWCNSEVLNLLVIICPLSGIFWPCTFIIHVRPQWYIRQWSCRRWEPLSCTPCLLGQRLLIQVLTSQSPADMVDPEHVSLPPPPQYMIRQASVYLVSRRSRFSFIIQQYNRVAIKNSQCHLLLLTRSPPSPLAAIYQLPAQLGGSNPGSSFPIPSVSTCWQKQSAVISPQAPHEKETSRNPYCGILMQTWPCRVYSTSALSLLIQRVWLLHRVTGVPPAGDMHLTGRSARLNGMWLVQNKVSLPSDRCDRCFIVLYHPDDRGNE